MNSPTVIAGRLIGYARVSTADQNEQLQVDALQAAGVRRRDIFVDHGVSGARSSRPQLDAMLLNLEAGDVVVVWKLDRLGRSSGNTIMLVDDLAHRGVHIRTLDGLDSTTTTGRAMLGMLAVFAEMERSFMQERTKAGLAAARAEGRKGGRPPKLDEVGVRQARQLIVEGHSMADTAKRMHVSRATLYRALGQ
ncbi:recombinase family protein [Curtobacterium sp. L1-20]|uniref:recombinase family protein n=1 Tax=Curtobacterium sp. L1-20 TaxID=3138181 RepID=UPI003B517A0B